MPKNSILLFKSFQKKVNTLEKIRKKQEKLFDQREIIRRDIEEVYSAIYIDSVVSFEALIEDLFIGLLTGQIASRYSNVKPKIKVKNSVLARDIVFNIGNYFDWFPYDRTEKIAKIFFKDGKPFTILDSNEKEDIKKCLIIRNAMAHKSIHSINRFNIEILSGLILRPRDKKPNSFLRIQISRNPNLNYYQLYILKILKIANTLC